MKKILALVFINAMLLFSFTGLNIVAETEELLHNGGFETVSPGGVPEGWTLVAGAVGTNFEISNNAHNGSNSARMFGGTVMLYQTVSIVSGTEYTFSAWVFDSVGTGALIKLEFGDGVTLYGTDDIYISASSAEYKNQWRNITKTFSAPARAVIVNIYCRLSTSGNVCYDDVSLQGLSNLQPQQYMPEFEQPAPGESEKVLNSSFEDCTNNIPNSWNSSGTSWGQGVSINSAVTHTGSRAVKVESTGTAIYLNQTINGITPKAVYQISAWVNADQSCANKITFRLYYGVSAVYSSSNQSRESSFTNYFKPDANKWTRIVFRFKMPDNTYSMQLRPALLGAGTMYIDDVSFYMITKPSPIELSTDSVFYYSDASKGTALAVVNPAFFAGSESGKVNFSLKKGDNILLSQSVEITDGKAAFTYDISLLSELKAEYVIEAVAKDSNGSDICTEKNSIYKYERPAYLGSNGIFTKGGESINPVIMYHVDTADYATVAAAGINVVQGYFKTASPEESMNQAQLHGLKVLYPLYRNLRSAGHPDNANSTRATVEKFKDHPALFGWMIMDEPCGSTPDVEESLKEAYKIIRDIDPNHPTYMLEALTVPQYYNTVQKYCDIFAIDPYPCGGIYGEYTSFVSEHVKLAKEAVAYKKPVYTIVQAYKHGTTALPTSDQLRNMLYQAFFEGSNGVGYYCFEDSENDKDLDDTGLWDVVNSFEYKEMYRAFTISKYDVISTEKNDSYSFHVFENGDDIYVAARNGTTDSKTLNIEIPGIEKKYVSKVFGGNISDVSLAEDLLTVNLGGTKACLYKFSEKGAQAIFTAAFEESATTDFSGGGGAELSIDAGINAGHSMKVDGTAASSGLPYAQTFITSPQCGATLRVKFWAKTNGTIPPYVQLNATQSASINWSTAIVTYSWSPALLEVPSANVWTYYEFIYKLPSNADYMQMMLRTGAGKVTYYDDITVEILKAEVQFLKNSAKIESLETGLITAEFNAYSMPIDSDVMLIFALYDQTDGNKELTSVNIKKMTAAEFKQAGNKACVDLNVESINENTKAYVYVWNSSSVPYLKKTVLTKGES